MKNKGILLCLVLLLMFVLPINAGAQEFDPNQTGSVSASFEPMEGSGSMEGAELSFYYVATVKAGSDGTLLYTYTTNFANCGISLDDPDLAEKLDAFVTKYPQDCRKVVTDSQGNAICENLPLGLYFVKQTSIPEGNATCKPFLITLPMKLDSGFEYNVNALPKIEMQKLITITIQKIWNTDQSTPIADSVTVQLLCNGEVVQTAVLSLRNDWKTTYPDMPESDGYSICEVDIPKGFTASYAQNGYDFTVTNTASLAQTGQMIWPIPVFALAGVVLLMVGFVLLRKPVKRRA